MSDFLDSLAARRQFGMRPSLDAIRGACAALGDPQLKFRAIHVAGTNGKGAVCAIIDAALRAEGLKIGRYTSPHLVRINERFFLDGAPIDDSTLEAAASKLSTPNSQLSTLKHHRFHRVRVGPFPGFPGLKKTVFPFPSGKISRLPHNAILWYTIRHENRI